MATLLEQERDRLAAEVERLREQRDMRATQVEEALSILAMVKDRVDDFTYDEFSSVLEDGPTDDERGDIVPSPLRAERDAANAEVERLRSDPRCEHGTALADLCSWVESHSQMAMEAPEERRRLIDAHQKAVRMGDQMHDLYDAANRTVVEQAATIEAVRKMAAAFSNDRDYLTRAAADPVYDTDQPARDHLVSRAGGIDYVLNALARSLDRAALPPVDGEKRNHDQEPT